MSLLSKLWPFGSPKRDVESSSPAMRELARNLHFEIVPMKSIEEAIDALPPNADVSVTCSPAKGITATQEYTERLLALGHRPTPHIAARLVESPVHAKQIATWLREKHVPGVFGIAGDATELVLASTRDALEGIGVSPARELFAKVRQHEVPVFV